MSFQQISLNNIRCIASATLDLHPRFNVFSGHNGTGKTSLLEAIFLLSRGYSFRTREALPLVTHAQKFLTVTAQDRADRKIHLYKPLSAPTVVTIDQAHCMRTSELARRYPCQVFYQDIFQIIDAGPSIRRQVLDWGLFHVEQSYHMILKNLQRCLKHRNALLRQKAAEAQLKSWDRQVQAYAEEIHAFRSTYFAKWNTAFQTILSQLTTLECSLSYYKGWDKKQIGTSLEACFFAQRKLDYQQQYTHSGPHQADIIFCLPNATAKHTLSRGQQKIILIALKLAQATLVNKSWVYLFDDISSELDERHIEKLMQYLISTPGQCFLTAIDGNVLLRYLPEHTVNSYTLVNGKIVAQPTRSRHI
jgi:DNA replication and repair protein RecF